MIEFFIETSIDKLLNLLRKKKRIRISEASKILKVSQKQIDEWVFTLEDRGIVDLKYPVLGEPEIVLKPLPPEEIASLEKKKIKLETRIIPGKPIKKEELPQFKPSKIPEALERPEKIIKRTAEKEEVSAPEYTDVVEKLKSLENKISEMASQRAEEVSPKSVYITEKLRFLESKLHRLSRKTEEEKEMYETEKLILEKIEKIENRLVELSKYISKEKEIMDVLKKSVEEVKKKGVKKRVK